MKTEITVDETVKAERKRVFWRLYTLPWILSVVLLTLISFGFLSALRDTQLNVLKVEEEIRTVGVNAGKRQLQQEAINNGHGEWLVNSDGIVIFNWKSFTIITNTINTNIIRKGFTDYVFTVDDYMLSRSLGMDLRGSLLNNSLIAIRLVFSNTSDLDILEGRLCDEMDRVINQGFDGFETYHRLKE